MSPVSRLDRIAALFFLLLGGYVLRTGWTLEVGTLRKPGAGFQPFALGFFLLVLATVYLVQALRNETATTAPRLLTAWKRPLLAGSGILLYWACLQWFGFVATTFLFLLYWLWILERESWRRVLLVSVSATTGLYVVFTVILRIRLPVGTLF
jgi:hypothetical protein